MSDDLNTFLQKHVEGYLFEDLRKMSEIKLDDGSTAGACGYPMLMTSLSGMELLGALLWAGTFNKNDHDKHFKHYWDLCLVPTNRKYGNQGVAEVFRVLARHGLAHSFLTKPGIAVTKFKPELHLEWDANEWLFVVNTNVFFEDFEQSYYERIKPVLEGETRDGVSVDIMSARLSEIADIYSAETTKVFEGLNPRSTAMSMPALQFVTNFTSSASTYTPPQSYINGETKAPGP
jgi:hypothetical protein